MSDGEASKDKDKVLLEYLHYKHYETCEKCPVLFRSRQWERFGRLLRNSTIARKKQALGTAAKGGAGAATPLGRKSLADIEAAPCAGSCQYNLVPDGWRNQRAWKRSDGSGKLNAASPELR